MRRTFGVSLIQLILVVCGMAALAAYLFPVFAAARESARKATCISNVKQLALACIMYCADYDEVLPACVADDRDGTAHAVGGVYENWKIGAMRRDVKAKYGGGYVDGRWMWQLADLLLPAAGAPRRVEVLTMARPDWIGFVRSADVFNCPTLVRQDPYFAVQTYLIGLDKGRTREDPRDPLSRLIAEAWWLPVRKVWQSGSYSYMCMHHPYGKGVWASDYGADFMSLWDLANLLGFVGQSGVPGAANPQDYLACSNAVGVFANPVWKPLLMCRSFGVHEGYTREYAARHAIPAELAPLFGLTAKQIKPTVPVATPMAFVDGHVKYMRMTLYEMLALIVSPNK